MHRGNLISNFPSFTIRPFNYKFRCTCIYCFIALLVQILFNFSAIVFKLHCIKLFSTDLRETCVLFLFG